MMVKSASSLFRLDGRVAVVTGASGHLGHDIAAALCEAGAKVIINARKENELKTLARDLRSRGGTVSVVPADISTPAGADAIIAEVRRHRRLDVLVNNAHGGKTGTFESASWNDFAEAYSVSVQASFTLTQKALPLLRTAARLNAGGASVINVATMYGLVSPDPSIYGKSGYNSPPYYGAAKAGLLQLTRYAACHLAAEKIRVNSISPGPFPRPELKRARPAFYAALCRKTPMGRVGASAELRGPVLFLASDAASYVTGANLVVDGGWTAW